MSKLESRVQEIINRGSISNEAEGLDIGRWLSKILIGILRKETGLLFDRANPSLGKIAPADIIEEFRHCHLVLQSGRKDLDFTGLHGPYPFTLFWYGCNGRAEGFDLSTNVIGQSIAVRVGGLCAILVNDGGLQMDAHPRGPFELSGCCVSPLEFKELAARVHYKSGLRDATHSYCYAETEAAFSILQLGVRPFSSQSRGGEVRVFEEWNEAVFSRIAESVTGLPRSDFYDEKTGNAGTWLGNLLRDRKDLMPE